MEEKSSGKKKARTTKPPAFSEEAVPVAAAVSLLTDELILEILSRLPARAVHRFKCVSPSWRDLIADPANRKKLPQTLAGFLYSEDLRFHIFHFAKFSVGAAPPPPVDPSLPFLPPDKYWYVNQMDTCNGLLLCQAHMAPSCPSGDENTPLESHYIVCNPATGRWVDIPPHPEVSPDNLVFARLAFDPAVSSHFHVLQFETSGMEKYVTGVNIYSSQTGAWNRRESRLVEKIGLLAGVRGVFFHGMLHLLGWMHHPMPMDMGKDQLDKHVVLVAVDMEGQVWKTIRVPSGGLFGTLGLSQGCLHYVNTTLCTVDKKKKKKEEDTSLATRITAVWHMKDYDSKDWILKHIVSNDQLGSRTWVEYNVAAKPAIHPDFDTIFLYSYDHGILASYDMQYRTFQRILNLWRNATAEFLPYVPLFSDSFADADR